jgi:hypothetical protein
LDPDLAEALLMLRWLRSYPLFLFVLLGLLASCGEIRIVPPDTDEGDESDDSGDGVALPLTVTIETPENGAAINLGENIHFSARVSGGTEPLAQLTATWTTADKKVLQAGPLDADGRSAFDKADLAAGQQAIHIEVTGGTGEHASRDLGILINTPPTAPGVSIQPTKPTTLDTLVPVLTKAPSDVDRAPEKLHVRYDWHKSGDATVHPGGANGELAPGFHKRGETWIVTAIANDGTGDSPAATAQVIIADAAPVPPVLQISPDAVDLLSEVSCTVVAAASDPDGDALKPLVFGWRVGDYVNPGATTQTIKIQQLEADAKHASLSAGAALYCTALAADDLLSAPLAISPTATVQAVDICKQMNPCGKNATCANSGTLEPICTCVNGYTGDGAICIDIDECTTGYCSVNATCNNLNGGFQCACKPGFTGNGVSCTDINECQGSVSPCGTNATCSNVGGSYNCACNKGYSGDGQSCTDIDECQTTPAVCDANATCKNNKGGYTCTCGKGFLGDGTFCVDVDECTTTTTGCSPDSTCKNTSGGFFCTCNGGYKGDGKICVQLNECQNGDAVCSPDATCTDTPGSYTCACKIGYQGTGKDCTDVDECADGSAMCGAFATCANSPGSFKCSCKAGFLDVNGDGKTCTDINECNANPCAANADCSNNDGGFACTCQAGFFGDGKIFCNTKDLCTGSSCGANASCATVPTGAASCKTVAGSAEGGAEAQCICNSGWAGCGVVDNPCADINECDANPCDVNADCANSSGSFSCTCHPGFSGNGATCFDVNECAMTLSPCAAVAVCSNTIGGYTCGCPAGYVGDGTAGGTGCTDVDECQSASPPCSVNATCGNTPGSFTCGCNAGFSGDGLVTGAGCSDVNECVIGTAGCAADATCANTEPGYTCTCNPGFKDINGDGKTCTDIDECANGSAKCSVNADCANTPGSFTCTCKAGYSDASGSGGGGTVCADIDECPAIEWSWDFATAGVAGWSIDPPNLYAPSNPQSSGVPANVQWQLWNNTLYYGNPLANNYETSAGGDTWANKGNATGPSLTLSAHPWHQLGFDVLMNTETATTTDKFFVQLVIGSGATEQVVTVWDKSQLIGAMGTKRHYTLYLNGYGGKSVRVRASFDTVDGGKNATLGVQLGNLSIRGAGTPCHAYATCGNTPGSFTCTCNAPYAGDGVTTCNKLGTDIQPASSCKAILDLNGYLAEDYYWLKWGTAPATQMWCDSAGWTRVVLDYFTTTSGAWTPKQLTTCGSSGELGGFGVAGKNYAMSNSLGALPGHTQMRIVGTVQCIDAWSSQSVMLNVDGAQVWTDTVTNSLGVSDCGSALYADAKRIVNTTFAHTSNSALVQFNTTLTSDPSIASYGIDDVAIWVK